MNIRFDKAKLKKFGIVLGSIVASLYVLFLISPVVLSPIANSYCSQIQAMIKTSTGLTQNSTRLELLLLRICLLG